MGENLDSGSDDESEVRCSVDDTLEINNVDGFVILGKLQEIFTRIE